MHGCPSSVGELSRQHGVKVNNVFDTQAAFSVILETEGLPPRKAVLNSLCEKTAIAQFTPSAAFQKLLRDDPNVWFRRPLDNDMIQTLVSEVIPLVPHLHTKLLRGIRPVHREWLEKMNEEQRRSGLSPNQVRDTRRRRLEMERKETAKTKPLMELTRRQRLLLMDTVPLTRDLFVTTY
ncbi:uncharacterized protein LOC101855815 [Aplysia californica]|uniref:Uncharacterized protein LOC101855815 n=1 Tax=Aplysia californica TaxID=6500 RepID=A0ABM1A7D2_APLCA|nr:uncharacterized protein LOC101855815 [Aplysia californica]